MKFYAGLIPNSKTNANLRKHLRECGIIPDSSDMHSTLISEKFSFRSDTNIAIIPTFTYRLISKIQIPPYCEFDIWDYGLLVLKYPKTKDFKKAQKTVLGVIENIIRSSDLNDKDSKKVMGKLKKKAKKLIPHISIQYDFPIDRLYKIPDFNKPIIFDKLYFCTFENSFSKKKHGKQNRLIS